MNHSTPTSSKKGFSLIEMLIYIAILTIIFLMIVETIIGFSSSYRTLGAQRIIEHSAMESLERLTRDIRGATSVDVLNSTLGTSPGVLKLTTTYNNVSTTTRFYVDIDTLKVDVNG